MHQRRGTATLWHALPPVIIMDSKDILLPTSLLLRLTLLFSCPPTPPYPHRPVLYYRCIACLATTRW